MILVTYTIKNTNNNNKKENGWMLYDENQLEW